MTEFCEAVAYAIYCVGLEGLNISLEALIYVYDGRISRTVFASSSSEAPYTSHSLYRSKLRHPDHTTIIEVDESLF